MSNTESLTELIDEIENFGHKFFLIINIATSDQQLSERARRGLLECGVETLQNFNDIERKIKDYRKSCAPS